MGMEELRKILNNLEIGKTIRLGATDWEKVSKYKFVSKLQKHECSTMELINMYAD